MTLSNELNSSNKNRAPLLMPRPRLDSIFEAATRGALTYVIAGVGHGKTQGVRHFVKQQPNAIVRWIQFTENDNHTSHCWEKLTYAISMGNPELAAKLRDFGFPDTPTSFKQFTEIVKTKRLSRSKTYFILDDFHLIESKEILTFVERFVNFKFPDLCAIIISRKEPDINIVSLLSKGDASIITENELRFTIEEATEFFHWRGVSLSLQKISHVIDKTKGWALALNMLSIILKKSPNNFQHALYAVMENIFKLISSEAWDDFPEDMQKSLVKFSLVADLPIVSIPEFSQHIESWENASQLASFVWFDSFSHDFKMHSLYLEFLQGKQFLLSPEEKQEVYGWAAKWCNENNFYIGSINYYAKAQQFNRIIETLFSYPLRMSKDASLYILNILENIGFVNQDEADLLFLKTFFTPLLLVGAGRPQEAKEHALETVKKWEQVDTPLSTTLLYTTYSNLAYIDMYTCITTHTYNAPTYLRKSLEYFKHTHITPKETSDAFINADLRSFACLVGQGAGLEKFEQFIEAAVQTEGYVQETLHNVYAGYSDLVACEYAFFKNRPELARTHAHNAIIKASEKNQYGIVAMAEKYLLRIAMQKGDYSLAKELLKQLREHLDNPAFWNRQLYYDLYIGGFYAQLGLLEKVPRWFILDDKEVDSEIHIPTRELYVRALYYISAKKYQQALTILSASYPREPDERFLFGELRFSLLTAVARIHTDDTDGALADFKNAYDLSFQGVFELFFIELGKELHPLTVASLEQADLGIPKEWLKTIDRKASIYSKKVTVVANALSPSSKEVISLSNREMEVLIDLFHGLSRDEIAEHQYLSINTVKKVLQSIYSKLDASNNVDAVRIALEKKIIKP